MKIATIACLAESMGNCGNQFFNTTVQLDAGVRLLSAQIHVASNSETNARELHLCHSSCVFFDAGPLHDWLWEIRTWMDANPHEVVTLLLVNTDGVDAREVSAEYSRADLAHYGYVPPIINQAPNPSTEFEKTWPTLRDMIANGQRLVSFINPLAPDKENAPYLLNEFDFVWENAYDVTDPSRFTCDPDRPSNTSTVHQMRRSGKLFLMNHVLYWKQAFNIETPDPRHVMETNSWDGPGSLGKHLLDCSTEVKRQPTFVLVDFFNVGPAIVSVDIANGSGRAVGRKNVTTAVIEGGIPRRVLNGTSEVPGPPMLAFVVALVVSIVFDCRH
ncbi:uncharacterized protein SETTUDRAFT_158015 [Exserohilum turcica Et28A]|uniref:PLC-like phosphodiesterase n=1 Tax=Exserohilum turcicum (strain 28A) TaxID=671987 RepID=R0JXT1_EXST2|nr:uncharacterized protein SETTUDRAFT_158015 [Exserohilum turcica Et28A]EOA81057.1 hypothetical protein SETTUDRAFT_158015 [Exserohilum turcica Et28A]